MATPTPAPSLLLAVLALLISAAAAVAVAAASSSRVLSMGINYGRVADNLPSPSEAVSLILRLRIGSVKIFDADPQVLSALANTGLRVAITVTNEEIPSMASSQAAADQWVQQNVAAHYPATRINLITVGNEVLTNYDDEGLWYQLVPAMHNVYASLCKFGLGRAIKISTSSALNTLGNSYPPSSGSFRDDIATSVIQPMLQFLTQTRSYFFVNAYPYLTWAANSQEIPLEYAMLGDRNVDAVQDGELQYNDLLDAQLDAVVAAMSQLGYPNVRLAISETGWPTAGEADQTGASIPNAAAYNRRLVKKMLAYPPAGTPRRPRTFIPTYLFALFNEDLKPGPATERNWGILYPNGSQVYAIDMTGRLPEYQYAPIGNVPQTKTPATIPHDQRLSHSDPKSEQHEGQQQQQWCVSNPKASPAALQAALDYACGQEMLFCETIQAGNHPCFQPNTLTSHASYAFNMYWQSMKAHGGTCDFNGSAILTTRNPSYGACEYP